MRAEVLQGLAYRKMDPGSLAYSTMEELVFPIADGRAALETTPAAIEAMNIDEVRATHQKLFTPER